MQINIHNNNAKYLKAGQMIETTPGGVTVKEIGLVQLGGDGYNTSVQVIFKDFTTRRFEDGWESVTTYTVEND